MGFNFIQRSPAAAVAVEEDTDKTTCMIYYSRFDETDDESFLELPVHTDCGHILGSKCLSTLFQKQNTNHTPNSCPYCRTDLSHGNKIEVDILSKVSPNTGYFDGIAGVRIRNSFVYWIPVEKAEKVVINGHWYVYTLPNGIFEVYVDFKKHRAQAWSVQNNADDLSDLMHDGISRCYVAHPYLSKVHITNLNDMTQPWTINEDGIKEGSIIVKGRRIEWYQGAQIVLIRNSREFVRFAKSFEDWADGF